MNKKTIIFQIDENNIDMRIMQEAADIIRKGGTVVFPTETVYGIGADVLNEDAVKKIFTAKGRPSDNPLIVHISDFAMINDIVQDTTGYFDQLSQKFWPGPLTMIMKKTSKVPDIVTAGLPTVAVRYPSDKVALLLIKLSGRPICAPSANVSGKPSATAFEHVLEDLYGKVDAIIQCSDSIVGIESTVIDLTSQKPVILRPGKVTAAQVSKLLKIDVTNKNGTKDPTPKSPGMKYRHYAPKAELFLFSGDEKKVTKHILNEAKRLSLGSKVGILAYRPKKEYESYCCKSLSENGSLDEVSRNVFKILREFDKKGIEYILSEIVPTEGIGEAIMNRLLKASNNKIKYL